MMMRLDLRHRTGATLLALLPLTAAAQDSPGRTLPGLVAVEEMKLGAATGADRFRAVTDLRSLPDGGAVAAVFIDMSRTIRFLDPRGRSRGDFEMPRKTSLLGLAVRGTTLVVLTTSEGRYELLLLDVRSRALLRTVPLSVGGRGVRVALVGAVGDDLFVLAERYSQPAGRYLKGDALATYELIAIDAGGDRPPRTIRKDMDSTRRAVVQSAGGLLPMPAPWAPRLSFGTGGENLFVSVGAAYRIEVLQRDGVSLRTISPAWSPRKIGRQQHAAWLARWRNEERLLASDSAFAVAQALPAPVIAPAVHSVFAAGDGSLAVVRGDLGAVPPDPFDSVRVDIISPRGVTLGNVSLPPRTIVRDFDGKSIWAARLDPNTRAGEFEGRPTYLVNILRYAIVPKRQ